MAKVYIGTGRRKSSVAQVKMTSGKLLSREDWVIHGFTVIMGHVWKG